MSGRAILLLSCPDQKGLVARLAEFVHGHEGNIIHSDHHTDFETGLFLTRLEWELSGFALAPEAIDQAFSKLGSSLQASWRVEFSDDLPQVAIWVTRQDHCLLELLWRQRSGDLVCQVPLVISNHLELEEVVRSFGVDYHHLPISPETSEVQEARQLELLREHHIDLVVLAKYMRILSPAFLEQAPEVINIHHSFLPAFPGARPYHQAYRRGVKLIGATAHYATAELDGGPIIEQDVARVSHRDDVDELIRKGRDLERMVLARAVRCHLQHQVLSYGNRTVVFR